MNNGSVSCTYRRSAERDASGRFRTMLRVQCCNPIEPLRPARLVEAPDGSMFRLVEAEDLTEKSAKMLIHAMTLSFSQHLGALRIKF